MSVELESGLEQPLARAVPDEPLRARAGVDPGGLDADDTARARAVRHCDAAQRHHLLRREAGHGREPADRPLGADPDLGLDGALPLHDPARDVLRKHLDEKSLLADHDVDRLLEELREARHVHALLVGGEIDGAVDDRRHDRLGVAAPDADGLLDAAHARVGQREADLGRRGLEVLDEVRKLGHSARGYARGLVSDRSSCDGYQSRAEPWRSQGRRVCAGPGRTARRGRPPRARARARGTSRGDRSTR